MEARDPIILDHEVRARVLAAIADDPRLPSPDEIAVDVYDGQVTLRGTVASFAQQARPPRTPGACRGATRAAGPALAAGARRGAPCGS